MQKYYMIGNKRYINFYVLNTLIFQGHHYSLQVNMIPSKLVL